LTRKEKKFYAIMLLGTIFVVLLMIESTAQVKAKLEERKNRIDKGMYEFDSKLGWRLKDGLYRHRHYDFHATYTVEDGKRSTVNESNKDCVKINVYGDSFTFGVGMDDGYTFSSFISQGLNNLHINNYGVAGYGPLQYFIKYKETAAKGLINIFFVYSGNDYQDIQRDQKGWGPQKPLLVKHKNNYLIQYPEKRNFVITCGQTKLKFRTFDFIKTVAKSFPLLVNMRNKFVKPDGNYVLEAINRLAFLFKDINKKNTIIVILPSVSLTTGISKNSNEGYFVEKLDNYLRVKGFNYINIHKEKILSKSDYWTHEGHNNTSGNEKIAKSVSKFLKERHLYVIKAGQL